VLLRLKAEPAVVASASIQVCQAQVHTPWGHFSAAQHGGIGPALQTALGPAPAAQRLDVMVSEAWVRYRLLPWRADLIREDAWRAYARQCFEQANMSLANDWAVHLCRARFGWPRLAIALRAQVDVVLRQCPVSVNWGTPFLTALAAVDEGILVVYDAGRMSWARTHAGGVRQVLSLRFDLARARAQLAAHRQTFGVASSQKLSCFAADEAREPLGQLGLEVCAHRPLLGSAKLPLERATARKRSIQRALALLAPTVLAMLLLIGQRNQLSGEPISDVQASALPAAFSHSARDQALDLERQLARPWQALLHMLEVQWPEAFMAKQLNIDVAQGELTVQGIAPSIVALEQLLGALARSGYPAQLKQATAASLSGRAKAGVDFEVTIKWTR